MKIECVIIGIGSHANSLLSAINNTGKYKVSYFIDRFEDQTSEIKFNIPVMGKGQNIIKTLKELNIDKIFLAISDNTERETLYNLLKKNSFILPNLFSKSSIISDTIEIGDGNIFLENTYVGPNSKIGSNNLFNTSSLIEHDCTIGSSNHFSPRSLVCGNSKVGNQCRIMANCCIIDKVIIEDFIDIAAGSVVTKDIKSSGLYTGTPANLKRGY